jgi:hypothetical protein
VTEHETHRFGVHEFRTDHQVALVLARLMVVDDHESASGETLKGLLNRPARTVTAVPLSGYDHRCCVVDCGVRKRHESAISPAGQGGLLGDNSARSLADCVVPSSQRTACHPGFHGRPWNSTRSAGRWPQQVRGLSPPIRDYTDSGERRRDRTLTPKRAANGADRCVRGCAGALARALLAPATRPATDVPSTGHPCSGTRSRRPRVARRQRPLPRDGPGAGLSLTAGRCTHRRHPRA